MDQLTGSALSLAGRFICTDADADAPILVSPFPPSARIPLSPMLRNCFQKEILYAYRSCYTPIWIFQDVPGLLNGGMS
jgi:hypothetical protein